jgi:hypothetical protein
MLASALVVWLTSTVLYGAGDLVSRTPQHDTGVVNSTSSRSASIPPEIYSTYDRYLTDHYQGLNAMRGQNGLIMDTVYLRQDGKGGFQIEPYKSESAPTDIALDLLVQAGMVEGPNSSLALGNIDLVLKKLNSIDYHHDTGLFYRLYEDKNGKTVPKIRDISSVDNIHLSLALWTIAQKFKGTSKGQLAQKLFDRMNYSPFYDPKTKLIGGNLHFEENAGKPQWKLEDFRYHFGSEARSVYVLGYALGLFKTPGANSAAIRESLGIVPIEFTKEDKILKVWDGGIFQELLPQLLVGESLYSPVMKKSAHNLILRMNKDSLPLNTPSGTIYLPPGYSAGVEEVIKKEGKLKIIYNGKVGYLPLVSEKNNDPVKSNAITAHSVLLAAVVDPLNFAPALRNMEKVESGTYKWYLPKFGWTDSIHLSEGKGGMKTPTVNSVGVGVDQGIATLALMKILNSTTLSVSGLALNHDLITQQKLREAYSIIDGRSQGQ